jgi:Carboxypeptidase regulatory-like domain/TonB-dependent Receptor Plug Domain/TonB dependent receptor
MPSRGARYTCVYFGVVVAAGLIFSLPSRLSAQVVGATVSGTVVDSSGAKVPGVDITTTNIGTGIATTTQTKTDGVFVAPNLNPGSYEISAVAKGFSTLVRKGITLTVGQELILNLTLQVGGVNEQVTVTAEAPTVNLANATIGGLVEERTVQELPLNGRSWTDLAALQPGVHQSQDQPPITAGDRIKRGLGLELTISGGRPQQNNYLLDGVNINDYANAGPGSVLGGNLGTDAVAEFAVLTTNYSAEYGRTSGGVITATTKAGTNDFHGSAYEFFRNDALDAASFIDNENGNPKPPFRRNQFGASAGGPIKRDNTFIFGDYEGVRQALGITTVSNVLSTDALNGIINQAPDPVNFPLCAAVAGSPNQCKVSIDPNTARFLATGLIPKATSGDVPGVNSAQFAFTQMQDTAENFFIIRTDHTFSTKDRIFATYQFDKASQSIPDQYNSLLLHNPMFRQTVAIEENHVFSPSLLNSARFGFNRDNVESPSGATAINPAAGDKTLGFIPGTTIGNITINSDGLAGYPGGVDVQAPFKFHWNSIQGYDNLFLTKGKHSMKFGANVERLRGNTFGADFPGGQLIFNTLYDFLTNDRAAVNADVPGFVTGRGVRQTIFGTYFQDDYHVRPNLSVNIGLRYEMASIITEEAGKLANLRSFAPVFEGLQPVVGTPGPNQAQIFLGSPYINNPTKRNFEPRVGFAWDPFSNGKTSVAGGFGIFDVLPLPVEMGSGVDGSVPFDVGASAGQSSTPGGAMQLGCGAPCGVYGAALSNQSGRNYVMDFNPRRNYVMQWNFDIQRELAPNLSIMLGYVGARGKHMRFQADDVNMVYPVTGTSMPASGPLTWPVPNTAPVPVSGTCLDGSTPSSSGCPWPVVNQFMGRTQMALWDGSYSYNGLQVQVKKAMAHGFQVEGSYTFSKNMDDGGGSVASDPFRNSISTLLWFCKACRRGLSDQDQRHVLTINYDWNVPTPGSFGRTEKAILGGWETGSILSISSGTPFTVLISGDDLGQNNTDPYSYPDKVNSPACKNPINPHNASDYVNLSCFTVPNPINTLGNAGRNSVIGPGLVDLDFSLFKNIPIREALKAQFRAEFFNIINHPNFQSPNDNRVILNPDGTTVANAGAITLMNTTPREIQFAMKFTW